MVVLLILTSMIIIVYGTLSGSIVPDENVGISISTGLTLSCIVFFLVIYKYFNSKQINKILIVKGVISFGLILSYLIWWFVVYSFQDLRLP